VRIGKVITVDERAKRVSTKAELMEEMERTFRIKWAQKIREEFAPYHEHTGGGECGSCGAMQAANFMDPEVKG
jgi:hypothetical protein